MSAPPLESAAIACDPPPEILGEAAPANPTGDRSAGTETARPVAVDLFAGAGGMTLGFEMAGFDVRAAVELDPIHCAVHAVNFPQWTAICRSAAAVSAAEIRAAAGLGPDESPDVLFGGPPCQGFSMMGKRALDDPRNALMHHFARLVGELRPNYFAIENVKGLSLGKHRPFLAAIADRFAAIGYRLVAPHRVLNAADFGVPQNRERLFLLGAREGLPLPRYPEPIARPARAVGAGDLPPGPTVREAIGDLPDPDGYPELLQRDWLDGAPLGEPAGPYARRLRGLAADPADFSYPRQWNARRLSGLGRTRHGFASERRFAETPPGQTEPVSRFRKLDPDGLCNTLRAGTPSSRGAFTSPRPIHPFAPRCITVREAARLHSYPDWFRFHGTKWHGMRQIGNSVPPLLARAVAAELLRALGKAPIAPNLPIPLADAPPALTWTMRQAAAHFQVSAHAIAPRTRGVSADPAFA